jgi:hypothetical protein
LHAVGAVDDGKEILFSPLGGGQRVLKQPGRRHGFGAGSVVDLIFTGATIQSLGGFQFQLAGGVVAAVAGQAFVFKNGLDVGLITEGALGSDNNREEQEQNTEQGQLDTILLQQEHFTVSL